MASRFMNAPLRPKNHGLIRMRQWHRWIGVAAAVFLAVFSLTGMVLNYKDPVLRALGLAPRKDVSEMLRASSRPAQAGRDAASSFALTTATRWDDLPTPPDSVFRTASDVWGQVALERVELRMEHGRWVWKLKRPEGAEMIVDAATGEAVVRGKYERLGPPDATGQRARSIDWGKVLLDLHTGKIAGSWGKAIMTLAGGALLFLTISGFYVWCKPLVLRRSKACSRREVIAESKIRPRARCETEVPIQVP